MSCWWEHIDDVYISIGASPEWEVIDWIALQEVSQNLHEMLHVHCRWMTSEMCSYNLTVVFQQIWS
jgi:hypothetical protein